MVEEGAIDVDICTVCLQPLNGTTTTRGCGGLCRHNFHKHCLERWLKIKEECPICRHTCLPSPSAPSTGGHPEPSEHGSETSEHGSEPSEHGSEPSEDWWRGLNFHEMRLRRRRRLSSSSSSSSSNNQEQQSRTPVTLHRQDASVGRTLQQNRTPVTLHRQNNSVGRTLHQNRTPVTLHRQNASVGRTLQQNRRNRIFHCWSHTGNCIFPRNNREPRSAPAPPAPAMQEPGYRDGGA